jgi:hypothetical protein
VTHLADSQPIIDVTQLDALPPPPFTAHAGREDPDAWLAAMAEPDERVSVYADSTGRRVTVTHFGLIPPPAIIFHDGVPAAPVEFIWKGDEEVE